MDLFSTIPFFGNKKRIMGFGLLTILFRDYNLLISVRWRTPSIQFASATTLYYPCQLKADTVSFVFPISSFIFELSLSIIPWICQYFFGSRYLENQLAR
jgi:hypothetical protein